MVRGQHVCEGRLIQRPVQRGSRDSDDDVPSAKPASDVAPKVQSHARDARMTSGIHEAFAALPPPPPLPRRVAPVALASADLIDDADDDDRTRIDDAIVAPVEIWPDDDLDDMPTRETPAYVAAALRAASTDVAEPPSRPSDRTPAVRPITSELRAPPPSRPTPLAPRVEPRSSISHGPVGTPGQARSTPPPPPLRPAFPSYVYFEPPARRVPLVAIVAATGAVAIGVTVFVLYFMK